MNVSDYLRVLREQWIVVALAVALGLGAAAAVAILRPATYTSTITLYVSSQQRDGSAQQAFQGAQLSQQRVASYVELIGGRRVSQDVVRTLGLTESADDLSKQISASSTLESVLIDVAVTDRSPARATQIADAVGTSFTALVDELERPVEQGAPQVVAVRVVQQAEVPQRPSSTGPLTLLAIGLLAGLGLGVAAAVARAAWDTSLKSPYDLADLAGSPNLGTIAFDPQVPTRPLTVHESAQSPRSEAFRRLRTNLQCVDIDTRHQIIVMTSALPGEGKTTTLANLAIAMASTGLRVLVIEADLRRPRLSKALGLDRSVGLTSVLFGRVELDHAVQPWGDGAFDVLASGPLPPNPSEMLASRQMQTLLDELRGSYDLVLLDTPPLLPVTDAAAVAPLTDGVVLVCRFKTTKRAEVRAAVEAVRAVSVPLLGTVFSMVPTKGPRAYARYHAFYGGDLGDRPAPPARKRPSPVPRPKPPAPVVREPNGAAFATAPHVRVPERTDTAR